MNKENNDKQMIKPEVLVSTYQNMYASVSTEVVYLQAMVAQLNEEIKTLKEMNQTYDSE